MQAPPMPTSRHLRSIRESLTCCSGNPRIHWRAATGKDVWKNALPRSLPGFQRSTEIVLGISDSGSDAIGPGTLHLSGPTEQKRKKRRSEFLWDGGFGRTLVACPKTCRTGWNDSRQTLLTHTSYMQPVSAMHSDKQVVGHFWRGRKMLSPPVHTKSRRSSSLTNALGCDAG
jgi:hypothetical protein